MIVYCIFCVTVNSVELYNLWQGRYLSEPEGPGHCGAEHHQDELDGGGVVAVLLQPGGHHLGEEWKSHIAIWTF